MNQNYPVYTEAAECQDCFKCVRSCPVKAIKIERSRAAVVPELCVACGRCVGVCPSGAKKIRGDVGRVRALLASGRAVYASLAPTYAGVFAEWPEGALAGALKRLGFAGVSETALGAELVSRRVREELAKGGKRRLQLSTACPAAVEYVLKYRPELQPNLMGWTSPMVAHARLIRSWFGAEAGVVFIGPCAAKKREADEFSDDVNAALTFQELREWLEAAGETPATAESMGETFVPRRAKEGAIYAVAGGMIDTLRGVEMEGGVTLLTVSGMEYMPHTLAALTEDGLDHPVFVELLACEGGCVNGPGRGPGCGVLRGEVAVRWRVREGGRSVEMPSEPDISRSLAPRNGLAVRHSEEEVKAALLRVGKRGPEEELNCGGCGYDTCRGFAAGLLDGRAEPSMCLSFLRRQAQKKANALLRCMPSGVVIADANLNVVECNERFARLFGEETMLGYRARPGMEGARLEKIVPFAEMFRDVLKTDGETRHAMVRMGEKLLDVTVFGIEPHQVAGGILSDVTRTEVRREQIAHRARAVIEKNLATVQEVACKLGEHMADTEILLRSIAEDYADDEDYLRLPDGCAAPALSEGSGR